MTTNQPTNQEPDVTLTRNQLQMLKRNNNYTLQDSIARLRTLEHGEMMNLCARLMTVLNDVGHVAAQVRFDSDLEPGEADGLLSCIQTAADQGRAPDFRADTNFPGSD